MTAQTRKRKRSATRENILAYLRNVGGKSTIDPIVAIFHVEHRCKSMVNGAYRYPRAERVSSFLRNMERDGLVSCAYDRDGEVSIVEIVERNTPRGEA